MADRVVTGLIEYLSCLLRDETDFLAGVEDRVNSLLAELRLLNIFLENCEGKRNIEMVELVRQIRYVAYEAEDVIDDFILKVAEHRKRSTIGKIAHFLSHAMVMRDFGSKMVVIKERINEINNSKERYGIERVEATVNAFEEEAIQRRRRDVLEDDVVGFDQDSTTLVNQLTKGNPQLDVVSIIGMGRLGKTTLASKIYSDVRIREQVRVAFPENFNGSRILITSRNKEVASHESLTPPYLLPYLNQEKSWELFNKKVFGERKCPPQSEILGKQGHVTSFPIDRGEYTTISLSYTDLPGRLKPCFLYFSIYPKDYEIPVKQLIHMWVAEGFIQQTGDKFPEDVAEMYLKELVDRDLIQVATWRADGGVKTCRIHALLQDFCISTSAEEYFLEVCSYNHFPTNKCRRFSIQGSARQYFSAGPFPFDPTNARSLFFLGQHTYSFNANHWTWVLEKSKLLRVLNFGRVNLYSIPTRIATLVHLRYLSIESAALRAIPASIGNLSNIETLDMRGSFLECLPKGIWKLRRLKNLYMSGPVSFPDDLDPDVTALENLHVLSTVSLDQQTLSPIFEAKLPNVRKLGLWFGESNSGAADVLECLHRLCHLQRVKVINWSHCPLRNLFPSTINKITLRQVSLGGMSELGKLPNLEILKLQSCLLSSELHVFPGTFPKLQVLTLENLMIKEWKQEGHAMPVLKRLFIKRCIELTILPLEVQRSTTLQYVEVVCRNPELAKMLKELQTQVGVRLLVDPPLDAELL